MSEESVATERLAALGRGALASAATSGSPRACIRRPTCSARSCSRTRARRARRGRRWRPGSPSTGRESVLSPALGGVLIGHEVAAALGVPFRFTERDGEAMALRRGFTLAAGERVAVVEDVVTTGSSTLETADAGPQPPAPRWSRSARSSTGAAAAHAFRRRPVRAPARARPADLRGGGLPALPRPEPGRRSSRASGREGEAGRSRGCSGRGGPQRRGETPRPRVGRPRRERRCRPWPAEAPRGGRARRRRRR